LFLALLPTIDTQNASLSQAFKGTGFRPPPSLLKTPPYVTATPVVTHRTLGLPTPSAPHGSAPSMRFVVLATDGLWDQLSSTDAVALVGGYLQGVRGSVSKAALPALVPTAEGHLGIDGKEKREKEGAKGRWAFVDDNVSAHLIRNAFGGGDELMLRQVLSIPAPHSRRYRDDVTVTVVWWEEGTGAEQVAKAKL
jgi:pyruvate dehydrogenase phosphatase